MTYDLFVSGKPNTGLRAHDRREHRDDDGVKLSSPIPVLRRFPPMLQFLTANPPSTDGQLETIALQAFRDGSDLEDICTAIYNFAMTLGFRATIGMQEVYCSEMPSFPNQTLMTALLMIDLQPLSESNSYYTQAS